MNDCIYQIERTKEEANLCQEVEEDETGPEVKLEKKEAAQTKETRSPHQPPLSPELKSLTPTEVFSVDLNEQYRS